MSISIPSTAYSTVENVILRTRAILNDMEVVGGDVLTDAAPFTMQFAYIAYERVQKRLANVGVEVAITEAWLVGLPVMPIVDPEGRMTIDDGGTTITYPNGNNGSNTKQPQLPIDLIVPLKIWERQTATTNSPCPMRERNGGLVTMSQQTFLMDWAWMSSALQFRGALQSQDIKLRYEKHLPILQTVNDPVPIRGVDNAAAYEMAKAFAERTGSPVAAAYQATGEDEIYQLQQMSVRRKQRTHSRRRPFSGRGSRTSPVL